MAFKGYMQVDLFGVHLTGKDAFGREFEISIEPDDARRLIFRLHRMVLEVERMRKEVNAASGGGKAA